MEIIISEEIDPSYLKLVRSILENSDFQKLHSYTQHINTTRLIHSINVSYIAWFMARKLHLDEKTAARAGLLHDFCLYDFSEKGPGGEAQVFYHPKAAAYNSSEHFPLSDKEYRAILSHMFPLGPVPTSREAWLISLADKFCAVVEAMQVRVAMARRGRVILSFA